MKIFVQAGIAAAAVTLASLALPAAAADLGNGGWGRGSIKDDYGQPQAATNPCYFRTDVGYSASTNPKLRWAAQPGVAQPYNERVTGTNMDDTWTGGVGLGLVEKLFLVRIQMQERPQRDFGFLQINFVFDEMFLSSFEGLQDIVVNFELAQLFLNLVG